MKTIQKLLITSVITMSIAFSTFASENIKVQIDGQAIDFEAMPVMENERVLVPIRAVFEKIGGEVTWNEAENTVMIEKDTMTIELSVGKELAYIHRKYDFSGIPQEVTLDVPAKIINDRTYAPVRFIAESLGMEVAWDAESETVTIKQPSDITLVERSVSFTKIKSVDLNNEDLKAWVEQNDKKRGIYFKTSNNITYILACAGEKPTGGYSIEINEITMVAPQSLAVSAYVSPPNPDMMVTQAITYPYCLVTIDESDITTLYDNVEDLKDK